MFLGLSDNGKLSNYSARNYDHNGKLQVKWHTPNLMKVGVKKPSKEKDNDDNKNLEYKSTSYKTISPNPVQSTKLFLNESAEWHQT